jgi:hypothetical protein
VLRGLLAHETQMTHLHLPWSGLPRDDLSTVYQQLGGLTALGHLCAMDLPEPKPSDCRALQQMQQLTMLVIPLRVRLPCPLQCPAEMWCCLHDVTVEHAVCKGHNECITSRYRCLRHMAM